MPDVTARGADSEIRIKGGFGFVSVGRRGTGELTVTTGANLVVEDDVGGSIFVAPANRSVGTVRILGEDKDNSGAVIAVIPTEIDAGGTLALGLAFDEVTNAGVATLIVDSGGTATAAAIKIGASGTVFLNGTLNGTVANGGTINPGFSPGTGTIVGDATFSDGGVLNIEVEGGQSGEFDKLVVAGLAAFDTGSRIRVIASDAVVDQLCTLDVVEAGAVQGTAEVMRVGAGGGVSALFDPAGTVTLVFQGCTGEEFIAQQCPSESFANHGEFVSCVAHAANDAVDQGLLLPEEKARFVTEAAQNME